MSRRTGTTLVEVLVAIFVMGIGLIALLTLFPIGMLRMARAIHDERCAQCALNAEAISIAQAIATDVDVVSDANFPPINTSASADIFKNPAKASLFTNQPLLLDADPYGASYPVLVDPIGFFALPPAGAKHWVGNVPPAPVSGQPKGALRRRPVNFVWNGPPPFTAAQRNLRIYQSFTLWDDMVFEPATGSPTPPGTPQKFGATVARDPRFSWAYTLWRPQTGDRSVVDCSVVVFDSRSMSISGNGALSEFVYQNTTYFNPVNNTISIDYTTTGIGPPLRPNDWILDVTPFLNVGGAHCYWYRIVASEEIVTPAPVRRIARYEVQQPIRGVNTFPGSVNPALIDPAFGYQGTAVALEGVAEVFPKGPIRLP